MPTYILDETKSVHLPKGPVTITLKATGPAGQVHIQAMRDGHEVTSVTRRPGLLVIPASLLDADLPPAGVDETADPTAPPRTRRRLTLRVVPLAPQRTFGAAVTVSLTLGIERRSGDEPERALLSAVDVAGLSHRDLVSLESDDRGIVVSGMGDQGGSGGSDGGNPLPELGERARVAAREILGVDRVPSMSAVNVVVALDQSASMQPSLADGSVRAVLEVIAGLSRVLCPGRRLVAGLMTSPVTWLEEVDAAELPGLAVDRAAAEPFALGFRSAEQTLRGFSRDENTVTYVVTDAVPADLEALTLEDDVDGEARHLVVIIPRSAWEVRDVTPSVPFTVVDPAQDDRRVSEVLLSSPGVLRDVVRSLLVGCFAPGTDMAARVAR